ncbi:transposase [Candidatus Enterovibrio escicola]|uniref:transposase n=1 Tax=Candidatus Enterovibrio escicola TaxID=1927127 RepID=UPI001237BEB5|nr:transposase [Candidatus Enterovibrio escacola]
MKLPLLQLGELQHFTKREDRERIEFVAMDMWRPYKDTVETALLQKNQPRLRI